jgi:outer membrane biogenesis lipoprotein LolB
VVKAITAVCNKEMGYLAASKKYNVPLSILCDYIHSNSGPSQAIQLASQNTVPNTFSVVKEAASKNWFKRFMKLRSDKLSRQPTAISIARIQQGNNVQEQRRSNSYVTTSCGTKLFL